MLFKRLHKDNTSIITNNGFLSKKVKMLRGLRQGCPLSLPLHVIQGKVTTKNKKWQYNYMTKNTKLQKTIKNLAIRRWLKFFSTKSRVCKKCFKILPKIKRSYRRNYKPRKNDCTTNKHRYNHKHTNWNHKKRPKWKYKNTRNVF